MRQNLEQMFAYFIVRRTLDPFNKYVECPEIWDLANRHYKAINFLFLFIVCSAMHFFDVAYSRVESKYKDDLRLVVNGTKCGVN